MKIMTKFTCKELFYGIELYISFSCKNDAKKEQKKEINQRIIERRL